MRQYISALFALAAGTVMIVTAATSAEAAKSTGATLTATPEYSTYVDTTESVALSGCGFHPSAGTSFVVNGPTATSTFGAAAGANGCVSTERAGFVTAAGAYTVQAFQSDSRGRWVLMASTSFTLS